MPEKPTTVSTWATDGGTRLEPTVGEKAAGFAVDDRPPARWINFLWGLLSDWIKFLDDPVGTGSAAPIDASGGTGTAPGLIGRGASGGAPGVESFGGGAAIGMESTGGTAASGLNGIGGSSNGIGATAQGGAPNGDGHVGLGTGTGNGVTGLSGVGGATGYAVVASGDVTSPDRSSLRVVPQDTDPTISLQGDTYVNDDSGGIRGNDGTDWGRYNAEMSQYVAADDETLPTDGTTAQFAKTYVIPANKLKAGGSITIKAFGLMNNVGASDGVYGVVLRLDGAIIGGATGITKPGTGTQDWTIDAGVCITTEGAGGDYASSGIATIANAVNIVQQTQSGVAIDTTAARTLDIEVTSTAANGDLLLFGLIVNIT